MPEQRVNIQTCVAGDMKHGGKVRTLIDIRGLRGFRAKSSNSACSPMSGSASGNCALNQAIISCGVFKRSNCSVGAKSVHVNVLSCL